MDKILFIKKMLARQPKLININSANFLNSKFKMSMIMAGLATLSHNSLSLLVIDLQK